MHLHPTWLLENYYTVESGECSRTKSGKSAYFLVLDMVLDNGNFRFHEGKEDPRLSTCLLLL